SRIGAIIADAPQDVPMLRSRFGCKFDKFLLVSQEGLKELQSRDSDIRPLGQANSAEIAVKNTILSPNFE
ncbi:MAG: hypothetical protein WAM69_04835, partial [Candidatus Sulfotelmatobacter sp.]